MVEGRSLVEVAADVGVDRSTLWKWRTSPTFATALSEAMTHGLDAAKSRIASLREKSLDVIESILDDVGAPPAVRLKAVEMVWSRSGLGEVELEQRDETSQDDITAAIREFARQNPNEAARIVAEAAE